MLLPILDKASKSPDPQWGKEELPYICFQIHNETYAYYKEQVIICSVADPDPGSGAFFTPGSGILDVQKVRIRDEQTRSYFRKIRNHYLG